MLLNNIIADPKVQLFQLKVQEAQPCPENSANSGLGDIKEVRKFFTIFGLSQLHQTEQQLVFSCKSGLQRKNKKNYAHFCHISGYRKKSNGPKPSRS